MIITAKFLAALIAVESSGNDNAVGDGGASHGPLQIGAAVVEDVNRFRKARKQGQFKFPDDCYDREKAKTICRTYKKIYCTERRLGRKPTFEDAARMWNGGPTGHRKKATEKYWAKVERELDRID